MCKDEVEMPQACFHNLSLFHKTSTRWGKKYGDIIPQNHSKNKLMQFCYCWYVLCVTGRRHFSSRRASLKQERLSTECAERGTLYAFVHIFVFYCVI
jgi:hypothetical protein